MTEKSVPAAELEIPACLGQMEEATAREIRGRIHPYRPMTHGSVVNLLKRLEEDVACILSMAMSPDEKVQPGDALYEIGSRIIPLFPASDKGQYVNFSKYLNAILLQVRSQERTGWWP